MTSSLPLADLVRATEPGAPAGRGRILTSLLAFLAVYALWCTAFARVLEEIPGIRLSDPGITRIKYRSFESEKDEIRLAFLGSSRVYRQFSPGMFDQELGRSRVRMRSFNFGLPGMRLYETRYLLDWILARRPAKLRWVLIEVPDIDDPFLIENAMSLRRVYWHTPALTARAIRDELRSDRPLPERMRRARVHLANMAFRVFNYGTGIPLVKGALYGFGEEEFWDGFLPLDMAAKLQGDEAGGEEVTPEALERRRREFLESLEDSDPRLAGAIEDLAAAARRGGVEPIFVAVPPRWEALAGALEASAELGIETLAYHDHRRFPELYDPDVLFNTTHLGSRGARIFTSRLARDFVALVRGSD